MGGEGSMMAANNSLKNNRNLVKKRKEKNALSGSYSKLKMNNFPKATPIELTRVKIKIRKENKQILKKQMLIVFILICLLVIFGIYLF